jgi:catechol 2,3-dioxygenase-like lactoylglutathione lyase family enzyme
MITKSVDHVSFAIDDLDASLHFYRDILGFEMLERPEMGIGGAWLGAGSAQVHLIVRPEGMELGQNVGRNVPLANHTAFAIEDYEAVRDHLAAEGLEVLETNPKQGQMWVTDPSGNVIEFISAAR